MNKRCAFPDNEAHVEALEKLIKKQMKDIKQYESDVKHYEVYVEYLENLLEKAGIPFVYNGGLT